MPEPSLVRPPVPVITPLKAVEVLSPPTVRTPLASVTLPVPANEPTVQPVRVSVPAS